MKNQKFLIRQGGNSGCTSIQATNATGLPVYNSKIKENEFHNDNAIGISNGIVLQDYSRGNGISCNGFFALTTDMWVKGSSSATHIEQIPKAGETHSRNEYSSPSGNLSFVANVSSTVSLIDFIPNTDLPTPPIYAGMASVSGKDDAPNCDFVCEDNENSTTASDDETLSVNRISGHAGLWIYKKDVNTIAFGSPQKSVFDVCIYNLYGQCGVELEDVHSQTSIDVSGLARGFYFISLQNSEGKETTLKFIKK